MQAKSAVAPTLTTFDIMISLLIVQKYADLRMRAICSYHARPDLDQALADRRELSAGRAVTIFRGPLEMLPHQFVGISVGRTSTSPPHRRMTAHNKKGIDLRQRAEE
jgi:hypothetical protein